MAHSSRLEKGREGPDTSWREQASAVLTSRDFLRFYILVSLFGICSLIYYYGELVDWTGWKVIGHGFFYGVHDIQRILFLVPVVYAGYFYRIGGALTVTVAAFVVFLPRAIMVSPYPDPVLRPVIFTLVGGTVGVLIGVARNEVERRSRLEALVRGERDRMLAMLENMDEGVLIAGPDHTIRFLNQSMKRDFGNGIGLPCYQYLHSFDEPCEGLCRLSEVVGGKVEKWEYNFPDGKTFEVVGSPFADSDGTMCQLATFRNITQRKQVELELIELDRLKSELVSNVSHELRSPLTSIKGIVSSLLQTDVEWDSDTREMLLTGVSEETDRLASLVTNLLNMSKIEAGVWKPEKERRNIGDIINETLEQQKWVHKNHVFETQLETQMPDVCVDYNQIKQVLINLLENAVAYSDERTVITVAARVVGSELEVSVSDQGGGIPAEDLDKLFDKFYRGSRKRQRPGGTGLGLAICQALVEAHDGRIWAESELMYGSTFCFILPLAAPCDD